MPRSSRSLSWLLMVALGGVTLLPSAALAQAGEVPFRPACQLADEAAVSAALGVDVVGDDSLSNLLCSYLSGDTTVALVTLLPEMPLEIMRLAVPGATDTTIAGLPALVSPGDAGGSPPGVIVALAGGGGLMVNVMPDAALDDPAAAATALAGALLAAGPVTATVPEEATGPAIAYSGEPCTILSTAEVSEIVGATIATAIPDGSSGCSYQTDLASEMVLVSLSYSDGTLASLRSGSTEDLLVADRSAIFWPDLSSVFVEVGGGRLLAVMVLDMSVAAEAGAQAIAERATGIAELAIGRMTPAG